MIVLLASDKIKDWPHNNEVFYFCAVHDHAGKADPSKGRCNPK